MNTRRMPHTERLMDEENPYWISFSDIMSGLLIVFILASLYLMIELSEKIDAFDMSVSELATANQVRSEMLREIQEKLKNKNILVDISDNESVLRIPADQLYFVQGKYDISEAKVSIVNLIGKYIYDAISTSDRIKYVDTIFIEGHTDSVSARGLAMGNWGLSSFRAITVWNHWRLNASYGKQLTALRNKKGDPIFSVSGYADTRRLDRAEADDAGMRQNRRIDVRFTMRQPDYKSLLDMKQYVE